MRITSEEVKYIDLLESVKKNEVIKKFVVNILVEKDGTIRTVMRILEVRTKKFDKNISCNDCNPFTFTWCYGSNLPYLLPIQVQLSCPIL